MAISVKFYKVTDDARTVQKTLGTAKEYNCVLKDKTELLDPVLTIQTTDDLSLYNYVYIAAFGRYYFITKPATVINGLWSFECHVDVLKSWYDEFKNLSGTLVRSENVYNGYLIDPEFKAVAYKKIVTKKFPHAMTDDCFILMTVG